MNKTFKLKAIQRIAAICRIAGIIAMLAAIAFSMAACGDDLGSGPGGSGGSGGSGGGTVGNTGTLTITGFSSKFEGKYVAFLGNPIDADKTWFARLLSSGKKGTRSDGYLISNGKVIMPVYKTDLINAEPYYGNDECLINILARTVITGFEFLDENTLAESKTINIRFSNGSATLAWSDDLISFKGKAW
jgi:hypothetical protein